MYWWEWLIIAAVLGAVEMASVTFVLLWIAIAAAVTAVLTPFVHPWWMQGLIFAILSLVLFIATRPLVRRWRQSSGHYESHLETRANRSGVVVSGGAPGTFATIRVEGELWSATCEQPLTAGDHVIVRHAEGTVLRVELAEGEDSE